MKLEDTIYNVDIYINKFNSWDVKEIKIDDKKGFWEIRKPGSEIEKVCLFSDGYHMCIYGDYGCYTFDKMTWFGTPRNLQYDNISYQNEKMSSDTKESVYVFDEDAITEDIIDWIKEVAVERYGYHETKINLLLEKIIFQEFSYFDVDDFCYENECDDLIELLDFSVGLYKNSSDEFEYIGYLRDSNLEAFDEVCESQLWRAGKRTNQGYLVSLLALKICGEKLRCQKDGKDGE